MGIHTHDNVYILYRQLVYAARIDSFVYTASMLVSSELHYTSSSTSHSTGYSSTTDTRAIDDVYNIIYVYG